MKIPLLLHVAMMTVATPILSGSAAARPLDAYRDVNRLIVLSLPNHSSAEKVTKTLVMRRLQIGERDLKIIDVSEGRHRVATALRPAPGQTEAIRKHLGLGAGESRQVFILIGKDGGEKARSHGTLDLEKWFALIDGMPMRRAEIRDQEKNK
ncbi:MAG: DUF4174 domain-containing protein [Akkermansiaceae bacterium]|jgi:hypothetical protein|nr:DUF4174 domain-containing protein [Akkermansiaceae bacterium]MCU0778287.1 DUF4174 domain-containing protein [Akkermansiaceae bacterium]